ncbi:hypothetical protein H8784_03940 [Parabacteroides acidifaciens]|jgi:hypothetical protein|uniref:Uncharacterized protein n=1 Tax=Parabacteroides acidifaciens TaxID=2290935 RepID=A0A3D8HI26_9BACT|nr:MULTISPECIES: hypothetical protein [Parabacteroides]MBC8600868.1 hypothetical protein [Parabacteroides acidifaciens]RDU50352.1 hypothetical protein DWU89_03995 [Parabacteroides acidifaciens]RHO67457.1 hypothetical protein DW083_17445 [Parabacteroides sp. AF48-14]
MTQLELQARKLNLIQDIINTIDNDELMSRLESAYKRLKNSAAGQHRPCAYTLEEVNERLDEAEKADKEGRYISHEDMLNEVESWWK